MQYRFPFTDVQIEIAHQKKEVKSPLFDDGFYRLNQEEFSMDVENVGWFYASYGKHIYLCPYPGASLAETELYLNGSCYGAILHQRKMMPLHGSCFVYRNTGIMICGESGAGKSSLTASFSQNGSDFLTDDVTPVVFENNMPFILPLSDRIKLWEDSLQQLKIRNEKLTKIGENYEKYYLPVSAKSKKPFPLSLVFVIEIQDQFEVEFKELTGIERFTALRNEIYRWEYLEGMPETEKYYLQQLINLSSNIQVIKVSRPEIIAINSLRGILAEYISQQVEISCYE